MRVLVTGSTGFIGKALVQFLRDSELQVKRLVRHQRDLDADAILWDPENLSPFEGFDCVVHLAGENIANRRWSAKQKKLIMDSRVIGTTALVDALCKLKNPPECLLTASAIGYYGNRESSFCSEETSKGTGFLADVCDRWEKATLPAKKHNIRTVNMRFGVVLSTQGGILSKMLPIFKLGLGGRIGSGKQFMSWVMLDDVVSAILYIIKNRKIDGKVNIVSPYPVTNQVFTSKLAKVLNRPAILPVPAFMLKLIFGTEMANELFLSGARVEPLRLTLAGYSFLYPDLEIALRCIL